MGRVNRHSKVRNGFRIPFRLTPPLSIVPINLIFLPVKKRRDRTSSPKTCSGKGTRFGNSQFLFPAIPSTKREWKVTSSNRSYTKSIYKETTFQAGGSQVGKTIDISQQLGCLHRPEGCVSSCTDSSAIQKIPSVHVQTSSLPIHGLTLQNVLKSVDFHHTNGCNSSALPSTCLTGTVAQW